jgi:hypothetical protein
MKLKDITDWSNDQVRTIEVKSDVCDVPLKLSVRKFNPHPKDSLKRGWMDGRLKKFKETTPFAIINMTNALKDMKRYVDDNVHRCVEYWGRDMDQLVQETFDFALKHWARHVVSLHLLNSSFDMC